MKLVILAGGLGSRLSEETENKPKPMVEIGGKPILWHIMKIYSYYGINDFIICSGYKGHIIKEYFNNYLLHSSDVSFSFKVKKTKVNDKIIEPWNVRVVDTGQNTMTGGRIKRIKKYLDKNKSFCLTYGDGVADINILKLINFHKKKQKLATITATKPQARFGAIAFGKNNKVNNFEEKPKGEGSWINGGFFVLKPEVINKIKNDGTSWEKDTLPILAKKGELFAYKHDGFWMPMDTLRDKISLNDLWNSNKASWKKW